MNEDFEFKVEKEGTTLNGTNDYSALVNLNLALLMGGVSESDLGTVPLTDWKIIVNATSNPNMYLKIESRISRVKMWNTIIKEMMMTKTMINHHFQILICP